MVIFRIQSRGANRVDPDEVAHYEPPHLIYAVCNFIYRYPSISHTLISQSFSYQVYSLDTIPTFINISTSFISNYSYLKIFSGNRKKYFEVSVVWNIYYPKFAKDRYHINPIQKSLKTCISLKTALILIRFSAFNCRMNEEQFEPKKKKSNFFW